jgi:hypothetical protein
VNAPQGEMSTEPRRIDIMAVGPELTAISAHYTQHVGMRNPEAAASLTLAHCVLVIAHELRELRKVMKDDPRRPDDIPVATP